MKKLVILFLVTFSLQAIAQDALNTVCPISGKPANPNITTVYEGKTFAFAEEACRKKFEADRAASFYGNLGRQAAIDAAVDLFYTKVLVDDRVKHLLDDVNMDRQRRKQKTFLSFALERPSIRRQGHADGPCGILPDLNDSHFNAIAEHLKATLEELKVNQDLITKVLAVVETTRDDVLNRPKKAN